MNKTNICAILCFGFMIAALLIAHNHPEVGYELDIYASTPGIIWLLLISSFLGGISIIFYSIFTQRYKKNKLWVTGLLVIIFSRMVLLYLPYIRGYLTWNGDNVAYLGMIKDIVATGHFTTENFYPLTHILLSDIVNITGIPEIKVSDGSTVLISVMFILFTYLLVGAITNDKKKQILSITVAGTIMLTAGYNVILSPNGWSILFMPLLFYLYFKQSNNNYRVLFIIILLIYPFFHPLSSLIVIFILIILEVTRKLFPPFLNKFFNNGSLSPSPFLIGYAAIEFMIFSPWILAHTQFNANINILWEQITSGIGSGKLNQLGESLNKLNIHGMDFYILLFKMYSTDIILVIFSAIGILGIIFWNRKSNSIKNVQFSLPLACIFIFCGFLYIAYLLGLPGTGALGAGQWDRRFLGYVDILTPVFSIIAFFALMIKFRNPARFGLASLIFLSSVLSIASLYPSPYIEQPNLQITSIDMIGTKWFLNNKDTSIGCTYIMSPPADFAKDIIGYKATKERTDLGEYTTQLADHFGYPAQYNLGSQYSKDIYANITKYDRTIYSTIWKEVGRFNDVDFNRLDSDVTVKELYSNGEWDIYYIQANAGR